MVNPILSAKFKTATWQVYELPVFDLVLLGGTARFPKLLRVLEFQGTDCGDSPMFGAETQCVSLRIFCVGFFQKSLRCTDCTGKASNSANVHVAVFTSSSFPYEIKAAVYPKPSGNNSKILTIKSERRTGDLEEAWS